MNVMVVMLVSIRQRPPGRDLGRVCRLEYERAKPPHLLVEQADRVRLLIRAQTVGADEFREQIAGVRGRRAQRPHLKETHADPAPRCLPGRLAARQAAADDLHYRAQRPPEAPRLAAGSRPKRRSARRNRPVCAFEHRNTPEAEEETLNITNT